MRALKAKLKSNEIKQGLVALGVILSFGSLYIGTQLMQRDYWRMAKVTLNDRMQFSFGEFSKTLQSLVAAETANEGRVSADSLNTLYRECKFLKKEYESDGADYLYPAFHAQLEQVQVTCAELAKVEQGRGLTMAHLSKAAAGYDEQLKATLQRVEPERAAWASEQMQTLAKD